MALKYKDGEHVIGFSELPVEMREFILSTYRYIKDEDKMYLHKKGGLYWKNQEAKLADDGSEVIIYTHLYPHEQGVWVRNKEEFNDGRFRRIYNDYEGK